MGSPGEGSVPAGPAHEELRKVPETAEGHVPPPEAEGPRRGNSRGNADEDKPGEGSGEGPPGRS